LDRFLIVRYLALLVEAVISLVFLRTVSNGDFRSRKCSIADIFDAPNPVASAVWNRRLLRITFSREWAVGIIIELRKAYDTISFGGANRGAVIGVVIIANTHG
jgi:hypothetical protein